VCIVCNIQDLKRVDRPLFTDYWERFLECIDILARKGQRTVFR
jgi:tRNA wybutosine-synthesizing protein 1